MAERGTPEGRCSASGTALNSEDDDNGPRQLRSHHIVWGIVDQCYETSSDSEEGGACEQAGPPHGMLKPGFSGDAAGAHQSSVEDIPDGDMEANTQETRGNDEEHVAGIFADELLTAAELQDFLSSVPLDDSGSLTSIGSRVHQPTACKRPCLFMQRRSGCTWGILCDFCHFPHQRKNVARPCKAKRDRTHRILCRLQANAEDTSATTHSPPRVFPIVPLLHGPEEARAYVLAKIQGTQAADGQSTNQAAVVAEGGATATGASSSSSSSIRQAPAELQLRRDGPMQQAQALGLPLRAPQRDYQPQTHVIQL